MKRIMYFQCLHSSLQTKRVLLKKKKRKSSGQYQYNRMHELRSSRTETRALIEYAYCSPFRYARASAQSSK
jgi:hypothetical protein